MDKNTRNPIELLTDMLATMTERAMKAEQERDEARKRQLDWYKNWEQKDKEHKETQAALAAEIKAHEKTKADLEEALHVVNVLNDELLRMSKTEPADNSQRSAENSALCHENA